MTIRGSNGYFGRAKFKGYLQDLPPDTFVGEAGSNCACPIAHEIARLMPGLRWVTVEGGEIRYKNDGERQAHIHPMPSWVHQFTEQIDGAHPLFTPVTAAEALAALD